MLPRSLVKFAPTVEWCSTRIEDVASARVKALLADGMSIRDIAEETGIAGSTVHRLKKRLERDAEIDPAGTAEG
jgi:transposase